MTKVCLGPLQKLLLSSIIILNLKPRKFFMGLKSAMETAIVKTDPIKSYINLKLTCQGMTVEKY